MKENIVNLNLFAGHFWFKINNLELALDMAMKFYANLAKRSKLKFRNFEEINPTFRDITNEKLVGEALCRPNLCDKLWTDLHGPLIFLVSVNIVSMFIFGQ